MASLSISVYDPPLLFGFLRFSVNVRWSKPRCMHVQAASEGEMT